MEITILGKKIIIGRFIFYFLVAILVLVSGVVGYFLNQTYQPFEIPVIEEDSMQISKAEQEDSYINTTTNSVTDTADETVSREEPEIKIYVTGCVNKPGVVSIKKGQIIEDALKAAGGVTKEADVQNINLAYVLTENTMLRIKSANSSKTADKAASKTNTSTDIKADKARTKTSSAEKESDILESEPKMNSGVDIISDSLDTIVDKSEESKESKESKESSGKDGLIDLNNASQAELEELPNVGPSTAKAIIDYREKNGGFKNVTDIMKITGIKQKTYDKIKDYISVK